MTNLIPFAPNARTAARKRKLREQEKERLIKKIGIAPADAPLYTEEIRFMAYALSIGREV